MKLIRETKDKNELDHICTLLESRGIPVHVGEEHQHQLGGHAMPFLRYRLHVVLDSQYDDALKLLEDENHEVAEPVDIKAFRECEEEEARPEVMNRMLGWMGVMVLILSVLLYLMFQLADQ
jgi:hypothetical protein